MHYEQSPSYYRPSSTPPVQGSIDDPLYNTILSPSAQNVKSKNSVRKMINDQYGMVPQKLELFFHPEREIKYRKILDMADKDPVTAARWIHDVKNMIYNSHYSFMTPEARMHFEGEYDRIHDNINQILQRKGLPNIAMINSK